MSWQSKLYSIVFTALAHHAISRVVGLLAQTKLPWIKRAFIHWFIGHYGVNMQEAAQSNPDAYANFNEFFTRELASGLRLVNSDPTILTSPVDGAISECGRVDQGLLLQAKGEYYSLERLLADPSRAQEFQSAAYATIYLAPKDYHRIHMPVAGRLTHMTYVPGRLFAVNNASVSAIPSLFARNERVIAYFDTEFGPLAMILVGAMIVASIKTTWAGVVAPGAQMQKWEYKEGQVTLAKGEEMGQFQLGSTVILLLANENLVWVNDLTGTIPVKMGQSLAHLQQ